jgi:hypothetical protein
MNERIRELVEQAQYYANEQNDKHGVSWIRTYNEKFAELIVKECLEACSRANEIRHLVPPTQQQVVLSCMDEIETHFGVEE